jgi:hypothetical protein
VFADASRPLIPSRFIACAPRNSSVRPRLRVGSGLVGPRCIARWPAVMASRKVIPVDSLVNCGSAWIACHPKVPNGRDCSKDTGFIQPVHDGVR